VRDESHGKGMRYALLAGGMALFGSATPVSKIVGEAFPYWPQMQCPTASRRKRIPPPYRVSRVWPV
jgi:hypothetical protein